MIVCNILTCIDSYSFFYSLISRSVYHLVSQSLSLSVCLYVCLLVSQSERQSKQQSLIPLPTLFSPPSLPISSLPFPTPPTQHTTQHRCISYYKLKSFNCFIPTLHTTVLILSYNRVTYWSATVLYISYKILDRFLKWGGAVRVRVQGSERSRVRVRILEICSRTGKYNCSITTSPS